MVQRFAPRAVYAARDASRHRLIATGKVQLPAGLACEGAVAVRGGGATGTDRDRARLCLSGRAQDTRHAEGHGDIHGNRHASRRSARRRGGRHDEAPGTERPAAHSPGSRLVAGRHADQPWRHARLHRHGCPHRHHLRGRSERHRHPHRLVPPRQLGECRAQRPGWRPPRPGPSTRIRSRRPAAPVRSRAAAPSGSRASAWPRSRSTRVAATTRSRPTALAVPILDRRWDGRRLARRRRGQTHSSDGGPGDDLADGARRGLRRAVGRSRARTICSAARGDIVERRHRASTRPSTSLSRKRRRAISLDGVADDGEAGDARLISCPTSRMSPVGSAPRRKLQPRSSER